MFVAVRDRSGGHLRVADRMFGVADRLLGSAICRGGDRQGLDETVAPVYSCRMTEVPPGCDPTQPDGEWTDPDLDGAARAVRVVFAAPRIAREKGQAARQDMATKHSVASRVLVSKLTG